MNSVRKLSSVLFIILILFVIDVCDAKTKSHKDIPNSEQQFFSNVTRDVDYPMLDEDSLENETPKTTTEASFFKTVFDLTLFKKAQPAIIANMSDIVRLVRFVLLRGHIVLDASHRVLLRNESRFDHLLNYLHDIQLRRGKHRILPMEDRDLGCESIQGEKWRV